MIWLIISFVLMLLLAVFLILLKGRGDAGTLADPIGHYKKQLADLKLDTERGLLDEASASAAKLEIERRLLKAANLKDKGGEVHEFGRTLYHGLAVVVILGSLGLYALLGSPNTPPAEATQFDALKAPIEENGPTFGEAITKIESHLLSKPDDVQGWEVLARTSRAVGHYPRAVEAYDKLLELDPDNLRYMAERFEIYLAAGDGKITPAAKLVLDEMSTKAPGHPAVGYYQGLYAYQSGNLEGAKAVWTTLLDRSSPNAPWVPQVQARLAEMGVKPPKISEDQMAAVNAMSEEERADFIASMMQRLRDRLDENPNDPAGWMMLARSEAAQGDTAGAIATLEQAIRVLPKSSTAEHQAFLDNLR